MASDDRWICLRYPGHCRSCGRELIKGDPALYERATRTVTCERCVAATQLPSGEVRADLVLGPRGEVLDGGGHGLLTCDKALTNTRVVSNMSTVKRGEETF